MNNFLGFVFDSVSFFVGSTFFLRLFSLLFAFVILFSTVKIIFTLCQWR